MTLKETACDRAVLKYFQYDLQAFAHVHLCLHSTTPNSQQISMKSKQKTNLGITGKRQPLEKSALLRINDFQHHSEPMHPASREHASLSTEATLPALGLSWGKSLSLLLSKQAL